MSDPTEPSDSAEPAVPAEPAPPTGQRPKQSSKGDIAALGIGCFVIIVFFAGIFAFGAVRG